MKAALSFLRQAWSKAAEHKRAALLLLLLLFLAFAGGGRYGVYLANGQPPGTAAAATATEAAAAEALLAVDVKGAVAAPGLYWLPQGSRVNDALSAAGLLTEADTDRLNLAAFLSDGQQLVVPYLELDAEARKQRYGELAGAGSGSALDLNAADLAGLMALPGIGETKAQAILDYRQQIGGFTGVEQLLAVPGIGEATLEQLRGLVYVE